MKITDYIRDIPDFPKNGIVFKDITPLLNNKTAFEFALNKLKEHIIDKDIDQIVGIESRGFIFGAALASKIGCGFVPVRKNGKLPYEVHKESYNLEYGTDSLEIHKDAFKYNDKIVIVDDVLATGGSIEATIKLVKKFNIKLIKCLFLLEIMALSGNIKLIDKNINHFSVLQV